MSENVIIIALGNAEYSGNTTFLGLGILLFVNRAYDANHFPLILISSSSSRSSSSFSAV